MPSLFAKFCKNMLKKILSMLSKPFMRDESFLYSLLFRQLMPSECYQDAIRVLSECYQAINECLQKFMFNSTHRTNKFKVQSTESQKKIFWAHIDHLSCTLKSFCVAFFLMKKKFWVGIDRYIASFEYEIYHLAFSLYRYPYIFA